MEREQPLRAGIGERRKAGESREWVRSREGTRGLGIAAATLREESNAGEVLVGQNTVLASQEDGNGAKRWRWVNRHIRGEGRVQRLTISGTNQEEGRDAVLVNDQRVGGWPALGTHAGGSSSREGSGWRLKRGMLLSTMGEPLHPYKKFRDPFNGDGEPWRGLNMKESCIMVDRAFFTECEILASPNVNGKWAEAIDLEVGEGREQEGEEQAVQQVSSGGGWPSTAASSP